MSEHSDRRTQIERLCQGTAADRTQHSSLSGRYRLTVTTHETRPGCWAYSKGVVQRRGSSDPIATICRNYSAFPFSFVEDHPNGHDYLVCGEDYQGQTVVELDTGRRVDYLPPEAKAGVAFCWASHHPSPDGLLLAVEGCVWAGPYWIQIVDFSEPMSPPWPCFVPETELDEFACWTSITSCEITGSIEVRRSDGKAEESLSEAEVEELDALEAAGQSYESLWETRRVAPYSWTQPADHPERRAASKNTSA